MIVMTPSGRIDLIDPPVEELFALRERLPFGLVGLDSDERGHFYGIVLKRDDEEVLGLKMQPVEETPEAGKRRMNINSVLIGNTLPAYLEEGFGGVILPIAYLRDKGSAGAESGIVYFVFPDPEGIETQDQAIGTAYDNPMGDGATVMIFRFIEHLKLSTQRTKLPLFQPIGLELRPRSLLGSLLFGFMISGKKVYYLGKKVHEEDPSWDSLRAAGIKEVYHIPSVGLAVKSKDLEITKGE